MKRLISILIFCFAAGASAATTNIITAKIAVITATSNNFAITVNSRTATITNQVTDATSQIITNHTIAGSTSNLFNWFAANQITGPVRPNGYTNGSNVLYLRGALGQALSVTILSNWATVSYSTQVFSYGVIDARVPFDAESANVATNIASDYVRAVGSGYTTNTVPTNAPGFTNYVDTSPRPQRLENDVCTNCTVQGGTLTNNVITNSTRIHGNTALITNATLKNLTGPTTNTGGGQFNFALTNATGEFRNGYLSNNIAHTLTVTNFSAPGSGLDSLQIGNGADASGQYSLAFGVSADASSSSSVAIGNNSTASGDGGSIALGVDSRALDIGTTAIGIDSEASAHYAMALGREAFAGHSNSVAIGYTAQTTETNQIRLGTSTEHVSIAGELRDSKQTNVWNTGTNRFDLAVSFSLTNISSLANGVNLVDPGLKKYIKVSGPTAAYSIDKITRGWDGREIVIQKTDSYTLTIVNESGSGGGAASDRILTGTGANITITNNPGFVRLIYDPDAARWGVDSKSN